MVVLQHASWYYPATTFLDKVFIRSASFMWAGVDLFFVISGFLITRILVADKETAGMLRAFYVRRVLRIFPLYYLYIVAILFILPWLGMDPVATTPGMRLSLWTYLFNYHMGLFGTPDVRISHLWSLAIEEQYYLVWPFIVVLLSRVRLKQALMLILILEPVGRLVLLLAGVSHIVVYRFTPTHLDGLVIGSLIALYEEKIGAGMASNLGRHLIHWSRWAIIGGIVAFVGYMLVRNDVFMYNYFTWPKFWQAFLLFLTPLVLAAPLVLCVANGAGRVSRWLRTDWLRSIGKYSYGMYVWHVVVSEYLGWHAPFAFELRRVPGIGFELESIYRVSLMVTGSIAAGMLSYYLYERWFLRLKALFPYRPPTVLPTIDSAL